MKGKSFKTPAVSFTEFYTFFTESDYFVHIHNLCLVFQIYDLSYILLHQEIEQKELWFCEQDTKSTLYKALLRPIMEYVSVVWDP